MQYSPGSWEKSKGMSLTQQPERQCKAHGQVTAQCAKKNELQLFFLLLNGQMVRTFLRDQVNFPAGKHGLVHWTARTFRWNIQKANAHIRSSRKQTLVWHNLTDQHNVLAVQCIWGICLWQCSMGPKTCPTFEMLSKWHHQNEASSVVMNAVIIYQGFIADCHKPFSHSSILGGQPRGITAGPFKLGLLYPWSNPANGHTLGKSHPWSK